MADDFRAESNDFGKLAADARRVPKASAELLPKVLEVSGREIRDVARENATGMAHAPAFPYSITYDFVGDSRGGGAPGAFVGGSGGYDLELEVGPDKERPQGALGNLIEYGSIKNPPQGIMHGALQAGEPGFQRGVEKAVDDGLRAAGLL